MSEDGQNFSVPCGDAVSIDFEMDADFPSGFPSGYSMLWQAWDAIYGNRTGLPIIAKSISSGIEITESPPMASVQLSEADTVELLTGNYYHELSMVDPFSNPTTIASGLMTVTETRLSA